MNGCTYTPDRAKTLTKLNIPEAELKINTKILWLDILSSGDIGDNHASYQSHSHSFFELVFPLSGKMEYECNGQQAEITTDDALFIPPGIAHNFKLSSKDLLKVSIAFSFGRVGIGHDIFNIPAAKKLRLPDIAHKNINYILEKSDNKNFFLPSIAGGRILEILCSVFEEMGIVLPEISDKMIDSRVLVAKEFADNNINRNITCEDVAKECCLSSKQLSRIFKNSMGISLFEYIVNSKVKYAKHVLLKSDKSIKEISFMLGFESESSFVSFFKRHTGLAPGTFRKQT